MSKQPKQQAIKHATFVIERVYNASPSRVFSAWAQPEIKARWFGTPEDWENAHSEFDFRVGGREFHRSTMEGKNISFDSTFQDIVTDERILYTYEMHLDDQRMSVSLATVEFKQEGKGTRLICTEQGAYLDEYQDQAPGREEGGRFILDALGQELERQLANAK